MPGAAISNRAAQSLVKLIMIGLTLQLLLWGYVLYQSYQGRADLIKAQRGGCERGKLDRDANARGWRTAEAARKAEGQIHIADLYAHIAAGQEKRSRIDCSKAYPKASLLP